MKYKFNKLLCWLGIHRYKIIDVLYGFGPGAAVETIECKVRGIKKKRNK